MSDLIEQAWQHYLTDEPITQDEAASVWSAIHHFMEASPERVEKIIKLTRWIDAEAVRGKRCSVCAGIEGSHDDC